MNVSARSSKKGEKGASTGSTMAKEPAGKIAVPFRTLEGMESLSLGFRQEMLSLGDKKEGGSVMCGAGLGTDFIIMEWKGKQCFVRGLDLLRVWVEGFAPEDAKRFPK